MGGNYTQMHATIQWKVGSKGKKGKKRSLIRLLNYGSMVKQGAKVYDLQSNNIY